MGGGIENYTPLRLRFRSVARLSLTIKGGIARLRLILTVIRPENDFGLGLMSLYYIYYMCPYRYPICTLLVPNLHFYWYLICTASVPDLHYVFFVV